MCLSLPFMCAAAVCGGEAPTPGVVGPGRGLSDGPTAGLSLCVHHAQTHRTQSAPGGPQQDLPR